MDARLQDAHPHGNAEKQIGGGSVYAKPVENNEAGECNARKAQPDERQVGCIKERDDDDGAEVVKGCQSEQKHLQRQRYA
jgi:hypothetical protein